MINLTDKYNNLLNALCILTSMMVLFWSYWARMNMIVFIPTFNYFMIFALASIIFSLPDYLYRLYPSKNKWYRSSEFYTVLLIVFLTILGILFSEYSYWYSLMILPIGIALAIYELYQVCRSKYLLTITGGLALMGLIILMFYSAYYQSPLFPEKIILGRANIDTLFQSSMSNMFSTLGWISTGLDGSPFVHYHFGSHILFAGLKSWTRTNTLMFYNIAYPAIFIPFFFKTLFLFSKRLSKFKGIESFNILFAFVFISGIYTIKLSGFELTPPLPSESWTISFIFTLLYASILLAYISNYDKNDNVFFLFSLGAVLLISSAKISTGMVLSIAVTYLYLRSKKKTIPNILLLSIGWIIITMFLYFYIFPFDRSTYSISIGSRISILWIYFIIYLFELFIAVIVLMHYEKLKDLSKIKLIFSSKKYLDLEILFVITIFGFLGAMIVSSNKADVYYFCSTQLFFSLPYLIIFSQKFFDQYSPSSFRKSFTLFFFILFTICFRPQEMIFQPIVDIIHYKKDINRLSSQKLAAKSLLIDLYKIDKGPNKKTICVYIPKSEKWFYDSLSNSPIGSPMVVPAFSGIALVAGIPDNIYNSNINYFGYYYYRRIKPIAVRTIFQAKDWALKNKYDKLIEYQFINGALVKQSFDLRN